MIKSNLHPEMVWDLLYSNDQSGQVAQAIEYYYDNIFQEINQPKKRTNVSHWVRLFGKSTVNKAKEVIVQL